MAHEIFGERFLDRRAAWHRVGLQCVEEKLRALLVLKKIKGDFEVTLRPRIDSNEKTLSRMSEVEVKRFVASTKKTPCAGVFKNERKEPSGSVGTSPATLSEKGKGRPEPVAGRGLWVVRV